MENIYKVASSAIIHELLDNEVIIANLDTGIYYSLREIAVPFWQLLTSDCHLPKIITLISEKYSLNPQDISATLSDFVNQLIDENLLACVTTENHYSDTPALLWPTEFHIPQLEKYEEMKDLLMLDPIHEVDEQGWPSKSQIAQ